MDKPTVEELNKVAEYWRWVEQIACPHREVVLTSSDEGPVCHRCLRPLSWISDVQLEDRIEKAVTKALKEAGIDVDA